MNFPAVTRLQLITRWPLSKASHVTCRNFTSRLFLSQLVFSLWQKLAFLTTTGVGLTCECYCTCSLLPLYWSMSTLTDKHYVAHNVAQYHIVTEMFPNRLFQAEKMKQEYHQWTGQPSLAYFCPFRIVLTMGLMWQYYRNCIILK